MNMINDTKKEELHKLVYAILKNLNYKDIVSEKSMNKLNNLFNFILLKFFSKIYFKHGKKDLSLVDLKSDYTNKLFPIIDSILINPYNRENCSICENFIKEGIDDTKHKANCDSLSISKKIVTRLNNKFGIFQKNFKEESQVNLDDYLKISLVQFISYGLEYLFTELLEVCHVYKVESKSKKIRKHHIDKALKMDAEFSYIFKDYKISKSKSFYYGMNMIRQYLNENKYYETLECFNSRVIQDIITPFMLNNYGKSSENFFRKTIVHEITSKQEYHRIIKNKHKVIIDFYAPWCKPCRHIAPKIRDLSICSPDIYFCKLSSNLNFEPEEIKCFPTFIFYKDGEKVDTVKGCKLFDYNYTDFSTFF